jgi:pyruvate,water dikinase
VTAIAQATEFIRWFDQVGIEDVSLVGGKNASLGEMYRELSSHGVKIPNGFATTADAYRHFLSQTGLDEKIQHILADLDTANIHNLRQRGSQVRHAILETDLPDDLRRAILQAYEQLCRERGDVADVAVRSRTRAVAALPRCSRTGRSRTASTKASTISRSVCRSACSKWCGPMSARPA